MGLPCYCWHCLAVVEEMGSVCQYLPVVVFCECDEVGPPKMTAVQQPPVGEGGLHWDAGNIVDSDLEDFEDDESNSAKLFERSRIRALAGTFEYHHR